MEQKHDNWQVEKIDSLVISEQYDTAFVLIKNIKLKDIKNDNERAYYGIVKTHIVIGKDIEQKNDSLLDNSIRYYEKQEL